MTSETPRMTREELAQASPEDRIGSVWPFVLTHVAKFYNGLSSRERIGFSQQDLQQEVWIELRQKDDKFDPAVAQYITFANRIVRNRLVTLRDRGGVVIGPKDARRTLRLYGERAQAGTLTKLKRRTYDAIARIAATASIDMAPEDLAPLDDRNPAAIVEERDEARLRRQLVIRAIAGLTPVEAQALGSLYGLWGREPMTTAEMAAKLGVTIDDVANIRRRAFRRIARFLSQPGGTGPFSVN